MRLEDLLGKRVRYQGEVGRIIEGQADSEATVVISFAAKPGRPSEVVTVTESEGERLELLG